MIRNFFFHFFSNSTALIENIRRKKAFSFRIGFGPEIEKLRDGLRRILLTNPPIEIYKEAKKLSLDGLIEGCLPE